MLFDTDDNYVVLEMTGPDGKERRYELLDIVEFEGVAYGVFCPQEFPEDGDIILRLEGEDAQKPEGYVPVEDEGIAQAVYDIFHLKNMSSFDFRTLLSAPAAPQVRPPLFRPESPPPLLPGGGTRPASAAFPRRLSCS